MFDPDQLEAVGRQLRGLDPPLQIRFHPAPEGELSAVLERAAQALARGAQGGARLERGDGSRLPNTPALELSRPGRGRVAYLGLPEEQEAQPFAELLGGGEPAGARLSPEPAAALAALERPAELLLFVSPHCPHCPNAVCAAVWLVLAGPAVNATIVDVGRFPELAERYQVRSAPTTLLDGGLTLTGVVPPDELARHVLDRDAPGQRLVVFESLVDCGRFEAAAEILGAPGGTELFLELWRRSSTSSRIGLMLIAEAALGRAPDALQGAMPGLIAVLASEDDALRGDTADLLGQSGHPDARPALEALLLDPNPDVAEIAAEALGLEE